MVRRWMTWRALGSACLVACGGARAPAAPEQPVTPVFTGAQPTSMTPTPNGTTRSEPSAIGPGPAATLSDASVGPVREGAQDAGVDPLATILDPAQWPAYPEVPFPVDNAYSDDKALLGKFLFWDEQLSADDTVACGTCHRPAAGGSDPRPAEDGYLGHPGADGVRGTDDDPKGSPGVAACSIGAGGDIERSSDPIFADAPQVGRRRAPGVLDAMFSETLFWDSRAGSALSDPETGMFVMEDATLETQALEPLMNPAEMACKGWSWSMLSQKVAAAKPLSLARELPAQLLAAQQTADTYGDLFQRAYGDPAVTPIRIVQAIATYERTLVANRTPWDRWQAGDEAAMSDTEQRGFAIFIERGGCACCHQVPLFESNVRFGNGFSESSWDGGGAETEGSTPPYTNPLFRSVSVRNVGLREPSGLLHDGVAPGTSLEALVAAYNEGPVQSVSACRRPLSLTETEQADLVAFLRNALTDPRAASESPPFDRPKLASEP